ncbi:hypothetical protein [Peptoniphilus phoceensis]|uniref:hypothetical protein n=1 Tax=Peptoniphilus phoceensis TaxID=1720298 RepID=UPI000785271D|nr:hypothetical protein [Peptoniphilus phoceensis]
MFIPETKHPKKGVEYFGLPSPHVGFYFVHTYDELTEEAYRIEKLPSPCGVFILFIFNEEYFFTDWETDWLPSPCGVFVLFMKELINNINQIQANLVTVPYWGFFFFFIKQKKKLLKSKKS